MPEPCLLAAVVQMALWDLQKRRHQAEVQGFIESDGMEVFCGWMEGDAEKVGQLAADED